MAVTKKNTGGLEPRSPNRPTISGKTAVVALQVDLTGTRNGVDWPARGVPFELPADEAADLVEQKMAVIVEKKIRETATSGPSENAAL